MYLCPQYVALIQSATALGALKKKTKNKTPQCSKNLKISNKKAIQAYMLGYSRKS